VTSNAELPTPHAVWPPIETELIQQREDYIDTAQLQDTHTKSFSCTQKKTNGQEEVRGILWSGKMYPTDKTNSSLSNSQELARKAKVGLIVLEWEGRLQYPANVTKVPWSQKLVFVNDDVFVDALK
jgi:hypothetical protein